MFRKPLLVGLAFLIALGFLSFSAFAKDNDGAQIQLDKYYPRVKLETSMGDFVVELDRVRAPITVDNFLRYVDQGSYENTIFHRIVPEFVVQGGGYDTELNEMPSFDKIYNESGNGLKNEMYTIAMARQDDPHSATRQFFFNVTNNTSLDPGRGWGYTVFGMIVEGESVVDAMSVVETHYHAGLGWADVPLTPVVIKKVTRLEQPTEREP